MKWPDMIRYYSNAYFGVQSLKWDGTSSMITLIMLCSTSVRVQTLGDVTLRLTMKQNFECQSWLASAVFRKLIGGSSFSYRMSRMRKPFWQFKMEKNFPSLEIGKKRALQLSLCWAAWRRRKRKLQHSCGPFLRKRQLQIELFKLQK